MAGQVREKLSNKKFEECNYVVGVYYLLFSSAVHIDKPVGLVVRVLSRPWSRLEKVPGDVSKYSLSRQVQCGDRK